ncbi:hypothetical protein Gohar_020295 [Gossypium harknessii]|uniref:RRM domain-containing protein n=1 Tax=Gossypium harknessii TaxID=34285 RepID=A0A7J9HZX6_9ROSI|nr:hypothetical protein [Gossypium harknessii]
MSGSLDMSLDDIIRNKSRSEGHSRDSRRKPRAPAPGPDRRGPIRDQPRINPYPVRPMQLEVPAWQGQLVSSGALDVEAKLYISNLDYGVSNEDIKVVFSFLFSIVCLLIISMLLYLFLYFSNCDALLVKENCGLIGNTARNFSPQSTVPILRLIFLPNQLFENKVLFSEVGDLKRYSINYDKSGRSKGTAEVVFFRQADALAAIKRYNNVQLDGKPMTIELVGANVVMSASVPPTKSGILRAPNMASRRDLEKIGVGRGWVRGGVSCRFGRGRGHEHERDGPIGKKLSAEDLDADLDKYHLEATRIK